MRYATAANRSRVGNQGDWAGTDEILVVNDPAVLALDDVFGRELIESSDLLILSLSQYALQGERVHSYYRSLPAAGTAVWFYSATGPTRAFDPTATSVVVVVP